MARHIGAGNAEFCDLRQASQFLPGGHRWLKMKDGAGSQIRRKAFVLALPAGGTAGIVAGGAVTMEESLSVG